MDQNLIESKYFEMSAEERRKLNDEECDLISLLGFDSNGMKLKIFDENDKKEKKLCYLNEYLVCHVQPIYNHPCYEVIDELGRGAYGQVFKVRIK